MNLFRILLKFFIVLLVLTFFGGLAMMIINSAPKPPLVPAFPKVTPVRTIVAVISDVQVIVQAGGTVIPARIVNLRPQVSGIVISQDARLLPGGWFREGESLFEIDPRDYHYTVEAQKAFVEQARFALIDERGRGQIAAQEWALLGKEMEVDEAGRDLALRKPHLRNAEAALKAAESSLAQAELNLERTVIRAPFNALIREEHVEMGQLVNAQTPIATLVGTDVYWVRVSIPVHELQFLQLPDVDGNGGSTATIQHRTGDSEIVRQGRVVRLLADLGEAGRMARLLVAIDQPLGDGGDDSPLLLGAYVHVEILGRQLHDTFQLPAQSLREGDKLWIMNDEDKLEVREARVHRRQDELVFLRQGLSAGEQVVISRIATPVPGMKLTSSESSSENPQSSASSSSDNAMASAAGSSHGQ